MRLRQPFLAFLVNFLLGVAWAFVLIGALYMLLSFYIDGLADALLMPFLGALPGLFCVVVLEYIIMGIERLDEMKKQTLLLEQLVSRNSILTYTDRDGAEDSLETHSSI